jgi:hypothetical protein
MLPNAQNGEPAVDRLQIVNATKILASRKGLYEVAFGCVFFWAGLSGFWPKGWATQLASFALAIAFIGAYKRWIPDYYHRRFGEVKSNEPTARQFGIMLAVLFGLFLFGLLFGNAADSALSKLSIRLHTLISDPEQQIRLAPFFIWITFFVPGPRRSQPNGPSLFGLCGLISFGSVVLLATLHPEVKQTGLWRVLNEGGFGLTFVALGLYDHITLVLFLPKKIVEGNDE